MIQIIGGIILYIVYSLILVLLGWGVTIILSRFISTNFRLKPAHHVLCLFVALVCLIMFPIFFSSLKGIRYLEKTEVVIVNLIGANEQYLSQIQEVVDNGQKSSDVNNMQINQMVQNIDEMIEQNYPILHHFVDIKGLSENQKFIKSIEKLSKQNGTVDAMVMVRIFARQAVVSLKKPLVRTCWISMSIIVLLQLFQNFIVLKSASKTQASSYNYLSNDSSEW